MSAARYIAPSTAAPRPPLPYEHANPQLQRRQSDFHLATYQTHLLPVDPAKSLPVKFQEISRDGHVAVVSGIHLLVRFILTYSTQVGRMKIPTV